MNPLVYLASYDDLCEIAISSKPNEFTVPGINDENIILMQWLQHWGNMHYASVGLHEINEGKRCVPDFEPWSYISQFPEHLKMFWCETGLNIDYVCFNYITFGRINGFLKKPKIKYLIVGSGTGVNEWYDTHKQILINNQYRIIPINNAWSIVGAEHIFRWYVPNDFNARGTIHPSDDELNSMRQIALSASKNNVSYLRKGSKANPNFYQCLTECPVHFKYKNNEKKSGTMFINTMFSLLTEIYPFRDNVEIYIIGSDFDYSSNHTHFYSNLRRNKAAKDPLRYGNTWLVNELENLNEYVIKHDYNVYNLSSNPKTLLPFSHSVLH